MDFWSGIKFADTHGAAALLQLFCNVTIEVNMGVSECRISQCENNPAYAPGWSPFC
jgi:hypothetical protein